MPDQVGPIGINCDAPSYGIVRACAELGYETPLDVRWLHLDGAADRGPAKNFLAVRAWMPALGLHRKTERTCSCGHTLPTLERCTFILRAGIQVDYLLGQCCRCKTMFWQQL